MADIRQEYGTSTFAIGMTGTTTLANGTSGNSDTFSNTTDRYLDYHIMVTVSVNSSATLAGVVEIFVKGSVNNTVFEDDGNDRWIGTITMGAAGVQTRSKLVAVAAAFNGGVPAHMKLRLRNVTTGALTATSATALGISGETV